MVIEKARRMVEHGQDVMILLDSITRLAARTTPFSRTPVRFFPVVSTQTLCINLGFQLHETLRKAVL